jgi:flavin reductase
VCSVTDQPPTLLVCMNRSSYAHRFFTANGVLCVNLLGGRPAGPVGPVCRPQREHGGAFPARPLAGPGNRQPGPRRCPGEFRLPHCQIHDVGSHSIFYCEVEQMRQGDQRPGLVYFNRNYHRVGDEAGGLNAARQLFLIPQ